MPQGITSIFQAWTELAATTYRKHETEVADAVSKHNALFRRLDKKGRKRIEDCLVIAERHNFLSNDLAGLMALARNQQHVAGFEIGHGTADRLIAVADLFGVWRTAPNSGPDRAGLFAARIVVRDDHAVRLLGRYRAHDGPLAGVAVAAGAEHNDEFAAHIGTQRVKHFGERIGLVRVVDKNRRAGFPADQIEPPLGADQSLKRGEDGAGLASARDRLTGRDERVFDLKRTDQRQPHPISHALILNGQNL